MADSASESRGRARQPREGTDPGRAQQPVGGAASRLPERLVRDLAARHGLSDVHVAEWWVRNKVKVERRQNRDALKAYGNSVVPQVVAAIGRAILEAEGVTP